MAPKVLIADDSPTIQKRGSGILTGEGYEVVTVSNGVAAVNKVPAIRPAVVLADVAMPGKDGYEVCEFIKNDEDLKNVAVLLVFSETDPIEEERAAHARADGRISKPFNQEELVSTVAKIVGMTEQAVTAPEAAAPPPEPMRPALVTEPVDAEPETEHKQAIPDISVLSGGVPIGEGAVEEQSAPSPVEPVVDAVPPAERDAPEPTPPSEPSPLATEPVLVEEVEPAAPAPPPEEPPATGGTILFHTPSEIAEPVLTEDVSAIPPGLESPAPEPEVPAVAATTLESFSQEEAAGGQVRIPGEEEVPVVSEPVASAPESPRDLNADQIYAIVHKIVVKMSPPALSPEIVEDIARRFADEITREYNS